MISFHFDVCSDLEPYKFMLRVLAQKLKDDKKKLKIKKTPNFLSNDDLAFWRQRFLTNTGDSFQTHSVQ